MNRQKHMASEKLATGGKIDIRGIIFDYGNVLCHPQLPSDVEALAKASGLPLARFQELYWKYRFPYDRGDMTAQTYWSAVLGQEGRNEEGRNEEGRNPDAALVRQLVALDTASWARENDGTIRWIEQLHQAGIPLALLSNMPLDLSRALRANGTWGRFFQHCVFSCDLRVNKPAPEIYQACLKALELPPQQVLFMDDIAVNIEAAAQLGIHALLFDSLDKTQARVAEKFNLPVPSRKASSITV